MKEKFSKISKKTYKLILLIGLIVITIFAFLAIVLRVRVNESEIYYSKEKVALYIYKYNHLPCNFVTKSYSEDYLHYTSAQTIANGYNFGGDNFAYSGEITKHTRYKYLHECDIYTERTTSRGTERLVYNQYGNVQVFYTNDHYSSFEKLTPFGINIVSNIMWIMFILFILFEGFMFLMMPLEYKLTIFKKDMKSQKTNEYTIEAEEIK